MQRIVTWLKKFRHREIRKTEKVKAVPVEVNYRQAQYDILCFVCENNSKQGVTGTGKKLCIVNEGVGFC